MTSGQAETPTRAELLRRIEFEEFIADLSTDFLQRRTVDLSQGISEALDRIGVFTGVQRAGIIHFAGSNLWEFELTHEWHHPSLEPLGGEVRQISLDPTLFPNNTLEIGETMTVRASDPGPLAEILMGLGLQTVMLHAIVADGKLSGLIGLGWETESSREREETATLLKLVATMVSNFHRRSKAEATRHENQAQFDSLMASKVVGIILARPDGAIIDANQVASERIQLDRATIAAGKARWTDHLVAPKASMYQEILDELQTQGFTKPRETYFRRRDGSHLPVLLSITDLNTGDGLFLATLVDLSEREQIEAELRYRSAFDRLVAELSKKFIHLPAPELEPAINHAVAKIGEFLDVDRCRVFRIDEKTNQAVFAYRWVAPGIPDNNAFSTNFPTSTFPWCLERLRSGLPVVIDDGELPPEGQKDREILRSRNVNSFLALPMMFAGQLRGFVTFVTAEHPRAWPEESLELVALLVDILSHAMERKRIDDETRELTRTLEDNVRLRTLELELGNQELATFSYSVSHELRAPLRSIDGYSKILLDEHGGKLDDNGRELLERVRSASKRMHELIDALLQLSNLSEASVSWSEIDMATDARATASRLMATDPEREVRFVIPQSLPIVGEPGLLAVALENLLANAWKFTAKHPQATIEVGSFTENEQTIYFVKDDGAGFNPDFRKKLFGTFQRLHRVSEFEGHGIGLATVSRIIQLHAGKVWAEAQVEEGATFFFTVGTPEETQIARR
jgi:PAS domain S-box-containing protein